MIRNQYNQNSTSCPRHQEPIQSKFHILPQTSGTNTFKIPHPAPDIRNQYIQNSTSCPRHQEPIHSKFHILPQTSGTNTFKIPHPAPDIRNQYIQNSTSCPRHLMGKGRQRRDHKVKQHKLKAKRTAVSQHMTTRLF